MRLRHLVLLGVALFLFLLRFRPPQFLGGPRALPPGSGGPDSLRITQFYAADVAIAQGEKTMLCYGVQGAKTVRLTPPIETLWPALARCFDVVPPHTTKYTLTAEDGTGAAVSETATIAVGPARPKILEVSVNKLEVGPGEQVTLCFKARNASNYDAGGLKPIALNTPEHACFADHPRKTTTYVVKVSGPGGEDSEKVTVTVR